MVVDQEGAAARSGKAAVPSWSAGVNSPDSRRVLPLWVSTRYVNPAGRASSPAGSATSGPFPTPPCRPASSSALSVSAVARAWGAEARAATLPASATPPPATADVLAKSLRVSDMLSPVTWAVRG
ncbi:hypothetical protein SHKM778_68760 [Streptomyces sp. KM77-8]|uniref:Uncharacterized protein n=1 Tax=Streptomyces haneummycinicus TaxID=3074435 RepID=A0AAT9HT68_9ACTN